MDELVSIDQIVRYAETDQMGIAHHAVYPIWFEIGRTHFMDVRGHSYRDLEARGILLPISDVWCRLQSPARYTDVITIDTWLARIESRRVSFGYRIRRGDTCLGTGGTRLVCVDREFHPRRLPDWLREALGPALGDTPTLDPN
jgi:acyl-CoA thioester hydrolase